MLALFVVIPLPAEDDPASFIGLTLQELFSRFGAPRSVRAARGREAWQDDVVFVYDRGDFYIYKDRVWQAGFPAAMEIHSGDPRELVLAALGTGAESRGNSVFKRLNQGNWPLELRCDFDGAGKVKAVFIYRADL